MFLKPFAYIQGLVENKVILSQNALRRVIEAYTYKTKHDTNVYVFLYLSVFLIIHIDITF